jgi:hypothetical protein
MMHFRWLPMLLTVGLAAQAYGADHPAVVILKTHCIGCHGGPDPVRRLDLSTREGVLKGGARGPAVVPGDVLESILYRTVSHQSDLKMPQGQPKLPDSDIKIIKNWIEDGAPWEAPEESKDAKGSTESAKDAKPSK